MDLLTDKNIYGSSSDDDDDGADQEKVDEEDDEGEGPLPPSDVKMKHTLTIERTKQEPIEHRSMPDTPHELSIDPTSKTKNASVHTPTMTKGKRILSLASVLPPHVLAALTKQQQQHPRNGGDVDGIDDDDDDDDYSDDDHDNQNIDNADTTDTRSNHVKSKLTKALSSTKTSNTHPVEPMVSSFLHDLHQVGFTNAADGVSKLNDTSTKSKDNTEDENMIRSKPVKSTLERTAIPTTTATVVPKLGDAFVSTVQTTITKTQRQPNITVRDIHNENHDSVISSTTTKTNNNDSTSTSILPTPAVSQYRLKRPRIQAAPQVQQQQQILVPLQDETTPTATTSAQAVPQLADPLEENEQQRPHLTRKEIERALRRTNDNSINNNTINEIWNNTGYTQTYDGIDPNLHAPTVMANAQQQQLLASSNTATRIKPITTQIYDPSSGTTIPYQVSTTTADGNNAISSLKGKGKNQINALLVQAVKLERERTEQQQNNNSTKTNVQIHRANAKRKYGW